MKKTLFLLTFAIALTSVPGCQKKKKDKITEDDAAEAVTESMQKSSGGLSDDVEKSTVFIDGITTGQWGPLHCGVMLDTTNTYTLTGGNIAASYTQTRHYLLTCNNNIPQSIAMTGTHQGSYDGPRVTASTTGDRNWTVTGLNATFANYSYSGSLHRNGTYTSKVGSQRTFTTDVNASTSNLTVAKSDHKIVSGTAAITIACTSSDGNVYSFEGGLVFNGNNTATLTINGNVYQITF